MTAPVDREPLGISERFFARGSDPNRKTPHALYFAGMSVGVALLSALFLTESGFWRRLSAALWIFVAAVNVGQGAARESRPNVTPLERSVFLTINLVVEAIITISVALWARQNQDLPGPLAVGFVALAGGMMLAYARTRILASAGRDLADGPYGIAAREVRLLVIALSLAVGQPYWGLVAAAALAHGAVVGHLLRLRGSLQG